MDINLALLMLAIVAVGAFAIWRDPSVVSKVIKELLNAWKNRRKK